MSPTVKAISGSFHRLARRRAAVDAGVDIHSAAEEGRKTGLTSLWIETPPSCHLRCAYCFIGSGRGCAHHRQEEALSLSEYRRVINDFADAGGTDLGIPGSGEPFHPRNEPVVREIIETAYQRGILTTVFTTGDTLLYRTDGGARAPYTRRKDHELIEYLISRKTLLFIKYNSGDPRVQDALVDLPGYTRRRDEALRVLTRTYRYNLAGKVGLASSIMAANAGEIMEMYDFAKRHKLHFDCDTIMSKGRGIAYNEAHGISEDAVRRICADLLSREKLNRHPGGTYVINAACDRVKRHLYVDFRGDVYPCIGTRDIILLGNVRQRSLAMLWAGETRQALRKGMSSVYTGVCRKCLNYMSQECFSCLGRAVEDIQLPRAGARIRLVTKGCVNHRPSVDLWAASVRRHMQQAGSLPLFAGMRRGDGKGIWKNPSYLQYQLACLGPSLRKEVCARLPQRAGIARRVRSLRAMVPAAVRGGMRAFMGKRDLLERDLTFPMHRIWSFIMSFGDLGLRDGDAARPAGDLLPSVVVPTMKVLFRQMDDHVRRFFVWRFPGPGRSGSFSRTFASEGCGTDAAKMLIIQQWGEQMMRAGRLSLPGIAGREAYELLLAPPAAQQDPCRPGIDLSPFMQMPFLREVCARIDAILVRHRVGDTAMSTSRRTPRDPVFAALKSVLFSGGDIPADVQEQYAVAAMAYRRCRRTPGAEDPLAPVDRTGSHAVTGTGAIARMLNQCVWLGYIHSVLRITSLMMLSPGSVTDTRTGAGVAVWSGERITEDQWSVIRTLCSAVIDPGGTGSSRCRRRVSSGRDAA